MSAAAILGVCDVVIAGSHRVCKGGSRTKGRKRCTGKRDIDVLGGMLWLVSAGCESKVV